MSYELDAILAEDEILSEAEDYFNEIDDEYPIDDYGEVFDNDYVSPIRESEFREYSDYVMNAYNNDCQPLQFDEWKETR